MEKKSKSTLVGVSVGALAGVIAGILLAPKSGKETRANITNYIHEMKNKIADELDRAENITKNTYNKIVERIVKVYELEKKITKEDAKDIEEKLDKNYEHVIKNLKAKKTIEINKAKIM